MFCSQCGTYSDQITKFCNNCGSTMPLPEQPASQQQPPPVPLSYGQPPPPPIPPPYGQQQPPPVPPPYGQPPSGHTPNGHTPSGHRPNGHTPYPSHYASPGVAVIQGPGSYAQRLHSFGKSPAFLLGAVLFIIGSGLGALINFTALSIISLALAALPIIGLLLVYTASKTPQLPEKSLTGLTLFKVSAIIEMVIYCLVAALALIGVIIGVVLEIAVGGTVLAVFIFIMAAVTLGLLALFIFLYYVSILRIIGGIKTGLTTNVFTPLKGVMPLLVMLIILGVFSLMGTLSLIGWAGTGISSTGTLNMAMDNNLFFADLLQIIMSVLDSAGLSASTGTMVLSSAFGVVRMVGAIICVYVVYQFNKSIIYGSRHDVPQPPPQW